MYFVGLGTAAPPRTFTQAECWAAFAAAPQFARLAPRSRALLRKILLGDHGIARRHVALEALVEAFALTPEVLHARFARHAPALATAAATRALSAAATAPEAIDALLVSTCTGYLCPGLTSYVSEGLGLRPDVVALDLVGQGCGAAVPNWRAAEALVTARRARRVLSVCVEVCSAAFYLDDDPGVLVSACLFGDGAGAAVLAEAPGPAARRLEWHSAETQLNPAERDRLRFEQRGGMLRNILSPTVPELAAASAEQVLTTMLTRAGLGRDELRTWVLHPGGRLILEALRRRLRLSEEAVAWSAAVMEEYGNLSSASLYFVLETALTGRAPAGWWWVSSFGAGFSCHGVLLRVS